MNEILFGYSTCNVECSYERMNPKRLPTVHIPAFLHPCCVTLEVFLSRPISHSHM